MNSADNLFNKHRGPPNPFLATKREDERNEALDTFVYAHAALHGLIRMGMRLNEEAEAIIRASPMPEGVSGFGAGRVVRSGWMS